MNSFSRAVALSVLALPAFGCGPDPLWGTFSTSVSSGSDHTTTPIDSTSTPTGTGVLSITAGTTNAYDLSFAGASIGGECLLHGTSGSGGITITAGQTCDFSLSGNPTHATISSGSMVVLSSTAVTVTLVYAYDGTGAFGVHFTGTGMRVLNGTRE